MRKPEQNLWDSMARNIRPGLDLHRIENLVDEGTPDVLVKWSGKWVELKAPPAIPKRKGTPLLGEKYGLRTSQKNWLYSYSLGHGPRAFVLIRTVKEKEILLIPASFALIMNQAPVDKLRGVSLASDWPGVERMLDQ